ncbi:MAG: oligoendopeptidase F [Bacillus sp. (in: Bacteria)]|nr:oligoendopeptidase F [Bacillus sp. (in: firmicutes)]MCM1426944.1 oligoendopeptidase F [Eubacterium sp.]
MEVKSRGDVPIEQTWDLSLIYKNEEEMRTDMEKAKALCERMVKEYQGKLNTPQIINACLDDYREMERLLSLLSRYWSLAVSVDYYNTYNQEQKERTNRLVIEMISMLSFVDSEIVEQDESILEQAIAAAVENRGYLQDILRNKPHRLHPETERVLTALMQTIQAPYEIYHMAKLADMKFDSFIVSGKEYPLSYSLLEDNYQYEPDMTLRRAAFAAFHGKIAEYENVTAAAYNTHVQTEKTIATLRGFDSVIDYLLFEQKVTRQMYERQIDLIMEKLAPHMRKYAGLLKKIHHIDHMMFEDLKISVDPEYDPTVTIEESKSYMEKGLAVLGEDYVEMVRQAYRDRWVDFAQNAGKSTGGFCDSPYGKNSYILLTWHDRMADVFTLVHELGHAGHFKLCNANQSIFDTNISNYFVEAPSTMNELLMAHYLLKTNPDARFKRWVLSSMISHTYYHNFVTHLLEADYQRKVYRIIDDGGSVNAETLNGLMKETLQNFWGKDVEISDDAAHTWMRQPHYYMGLYSYTYSAGLTIATQVCRQIEKEGQTAVENWKKVLAAGSSVSPVALAKMAGVNMETETPLLETIAYIGEIIDEIERLT